MARAASPLPSKTTVPSFRSPKRKGRSKQKRASLSRSRERHKTALSSSAPTTAKKGSSALLPRPTYGSLFPRRRCSLRPHMASAAFRTLTACMAPVWKRRRAAHDLKGSSPSPLREAAPWSLRAISRSTERDACASACCSTERRRSSKALQRTSGAPAGSKPYDTTAKNCAVRSLTSRRGSTPSFWKQSTVISRLAASRCISAIRPWKSRSSAPNCPKTLPMKPSLPWMKRHSSAIRLQGSILRQRTSRPSNSPMRGTAIGTSIACMFPTRSAIRHSHLPVTPLRRGR